MGSLKKYIYVLTTEIFSRNYSKLSRAKKFNPGLDKRLQIFKEEHPDLRSRKIDENSLENLEQDINNSESLQQVHERNINRIKKKILLKQIERKYFSAQKLPNMLFWSEKEQIRYLYQTDPDLWTPEKLSECFPTTPDIVKKLIKSNWKPMNNNRIKLHDETVSANWKAFKMGQLNFPDIFARHLKSFTSRDVFISKPEENLPEVRMNHSGEFANIIKNYDIKTISSDDKQSNFSESENNKYSSLKEKQFNYRSRNKKSVTLNVLNKDLNLKECDKDDSILFNEKSQMEKTELGVLNEHTLGKSLETDIKEIEIETLNNSPANGDEINMKIKIPKEKWKKGNLYKVNNCFYTDDGEFLYRV
ncbi:hypothetical protein O3M35_005165 [Rhynocoris fuscipes]|uniref:Neugrin n=1 Tax=Rhynocoris fuscipes TaxID=488301 RepID=A0AAW1DHA3_9HEMI